MVTSVKMGEKTKSHLEDLQALIKLETGQKVTQQRLLEVLIEEAYASREDVIAHFQDEWEGLSPEEAKRWASWSIPKGEPISEEDLDDVIYQEPAG